MKKIVLILSFGLVGLMAGDHGPCKTVNDKGTNIHICTSSGLMFSANTVSGVSQEPANEYPLDPIEFEIHDVGNATVSIQFPEGHVPDALKKCRRGLPIDGRSSSVVAQQLPYICTPLTNATLNGNTWSYYIENNGPLDTNSDSSKISDPIAFQYSVSVPLSNSAKALLALLFAFAAFFMMNHRKIA